MAKRKDTCAGARGLANVRELNEILAVTGDDPATLLLLLEMCDRIIARRGNAEIGPDATDGDRQIRHDDT